MLYLDTETRAPVDLKKAGAYRYAAEADVVVIVYAVDDGPVEVVERQGAALAYADFPPELRAYIEGDGKIVCWNAVFDRAVLNYGLIDGPYLPPERFYDAMAQAAAANLPSGLDLAAERVTGEGKDPAGKPLIKLFSVNRADPKDHPDEWQAFLAYARRDVVAMRAVWQGTLPLPEVDWLVYWASERVNERGACLDLDLCRAAAKLAAADTVRTGHELARLTGGVVTSVNQAARIAGWIYNRWPDPEARAILGSEPDVDDEAIDTDEIAIETAKAELSLRRTIVQQLLALMVAREHDDSVLRDVLQLREFGASAAPKKFAAALAQQTGGRVRGQFTFNGAATGRWSGKGMQLQNMTRQTLGLPGSDYGEHEEATIEAVVEGCSLETLAAMGEGEPPARKLALIVRPALIAPPGRTLIKGDFAQVEARTLPWLSAEESAEDLLDAFRRIDADPSAPDIYKVSAAAMMGIEPHEVSKEDRQRGKVAILALGFQGGVRALMSMALGYGMHLAPDEAKEIVDQWRAANPWAVTFWGKHGRDGSQGLWGAALRAYFSPGSVQQAGRVTYTYDSAYLGGSLICELPSGRLLTYPKCKWREHEIRDKKTGEVIDKRETLVFRRPFGYVRLYGGILAENVTQATANDLLREAIWRLDQGGYEVVLHAHDEAVIEIDESRIEEGEAALTAALLDERPWAEGLPLGADVTTRWFYSAAKERKP